MKQKKNRLGTISLGIAIAGFLAVELQPWIRLEAVRIFSSLNLKQLLESFFEASMAGAFADWFAVSALFRDPLGIHLPHTNILAKNKDSIADAIPNFLKGFLDSQSMAAEFRKIDFATKLSEALAEGQTREELHGFLKKRLAIVLVDYGGKEEEKALATQRFAGEILDFAATRVDAPEEVSKLIRWARDQRFDEKLLEAIAEYARMEIGRNRGRIVSLVTPIVKRAAGWKGLFINSGTVDGFVAGIEDELSEIQSDKRNETRRFILDSLAEYSEKLGREGSEERKQISQGFWEALADTSFRAGFSDFVQSLALRLGEDMGKEGGALIADLERLEDSLASKLSSDEELRTRINAALSGFAMTIVEKGHFIEGASGYVASLLRSTDEKYFVGKIEESVWGDLQYIRLNGAVVGGLVGLFLALIKAALGI